MSPKYFVFIFLTTLFFSCGNEDAAPVVDTDMTDAVLIEINKLRASGCNCGGEEMPPVSALTSNPILKETAINYAHDMYVRDFFSHISPEGTSPIQRAATLGYTGAYMGEVIARNYDSPAEVVQGWKNSPDHCKAIMGSTFIEMGAGKSGNIWVANLGN